MSEPIVITLKPHKPGESESNEQVLMVAPDGFIMGATHIDAFWSREQRDDPESLYNRLWQGGETIQVALVEKVNHG